MELVKRIINEWDPIDLLSHAPKDEYLSEIVEIQNLLKKTDNLGELADGIWKIFVNSFSEEIFNKNKEECIQIARALLSSTGDGSVC